MKTIRCFLAVKLDLDTVRSLADTQKRLRDTCNGLGLHVAWVPPPNMHITLRFLGQVTEPMAYSLKEMLEPAVRSLAPFELSSAGLGVFPNPQQPRVIWAGSAGGSSEIMELATAVTGRLVEAGFLFEDRPFLPHITLGRVKQGSGEALSAHFEQLGEQTFGASIVRNIYCYRSDLNPQGAEYHCLWRLPFGKKWDPPVPEAADYSDSDTEAERAAMDDMDYMEHGDFDEPAAFDDDREPEGSEDK